MVTRRKSTKKSRTKKPSSLSTSSTPTVTPTMIRTMRDSFQTKPQYAIIQNAVTEVPVDRIANRRDVVTSIDHSFSIHLDNWPVTNQKSSGRCWMFAGLNLLRAGAMKKMNIKEFEFSQNYVLFWDKVEKANYFLEAVLLTADQPVDDRTVSFLLHSPAEDGGQWPMFVSLVQKYGLVPKAAMPETESSSSTGAMNRMLISKLREAAKKLRSLVAGQAKRATLQKEKEATLNTVHRILSIHLGTPPERFDWQWMDKKRKFHRDTNMTPLKFAKKYANLPLDDYVCLVDDPRPNNPRNRTYTVKHLGNVIGGAPVVHLNVEISVLKHAAIKTLQAGEPVWFGCDVGKQMSGLHGIWDAQLRDFESLYDTTFSLDKAGRLEYGETCMTHAMLFTGVDLVSGKPRRWRVENSWGDKRGKKGFYAMNDSWFDEHMFEVAVRKKYLPPKLREALKKKPIVLPPWDPMGSLAQ